MNALRKYSAEMKNMNMTGSRCLSARQHLDAGTIISGRETAGGSAAESVDQWTDLSLFPNS